MFHGRAVAVRGQVWSEHCVLKKHFLGGADAVEISIAPPGLYLSGPSRLKRWWRSGQGGLPGLGAVQPSTTKAHRPRKLPTGLSPEPEGRTNGHGRKKTRRRRHEYPRTTQRRIGKPSAAQPAAGVDASALRAPAPLSGALGVSLDKSWNSTSGKLIHLFAASKAQRLESSQTAISNATPR